MFGNLFPLSSFFQSGDIILFKYGGNKEEQKSMERTLQIESS